MGQLSFYSADAHPRAVSDLEGILCARGQVTVFGRGTTARLSVVLGTPPPADEARDDEPPDAEQGDEPPARGSDDTEGSDDLEVAPPLDQAPATTAPATTPSAPALDPADVEFLDLDPDELAAVLGSRTPLVASGHRAGHAVAAPPVSPPVLAAPRALAPPDPVAEWRAGALCCAFRTRGVDAELDRAPDGRLVVRSTFRADLVGLAGRWTRGAVKAVPEDLDLDGPRLRLWVLTAGRRMGRAYLLGLDPHAEHTHEPLLVASRRAGLGATLGGDRADPCLRIVGRRPQRRLGELVGDPPRDLAGEVWPE